MPPTAFPFNRTKLVSGPGTFYYGPYGAPPKTTKIFSSTGITAELDAVLEKLPSDLLGTLDTIKTDQLAHIRVTNTGHLSKEVFDLLYPWRAPLKSRGMGVFGLKDVIAAVHSTAGIKVSFKNCALVSPPELTLSRTKTAFGEAEFLGLVGLDGDTSADLHVITEEEYPSEDFPLLTALGLTGAIYTATWDDMDLTGTKGGWRVSVEPELVDLQCDELGTIDKILGDVVVTARCEPMGWTEKQILDRSPVSVGLGMSVVKAKPLVITGSNGLKVTLYNAALTRAPVRWGKTETRVGEIAFEAHVGQDGKLYDIEYTPPTTPS